MIKSGFGLMLGSLALAACSPAEAPEAETASEEAGGEDETPQTLTPVDTPPEPAIEAPALAPISRAEIEAELEPGAGCSVEEDGKALLVAVEGDAIARPYGTLRHFEFDGDLDALFDGGRFEAGSISVTVEPEDVEGEQIEGVLVKPATVTMREEGVSEAYSFEAEWQCGA